MFLPPSLLFICYLNPRPTQIGVIQASYSIGYAGSILFVSHFAEKSHKPRWVAAGAAAVAISCLLPLFPHFALWLPAYRETRPLDNPSDISGDSTSPYHDASLCHLGDDDAAASSPSWKCGVDSDDPLAGVASPHPHHSTMGQKQVILRHLILQFPTSKGVREVSE